MVMVKMCAKVATVGTALVLGGLLVACTDPGTPGPSTSTTTTTSSATPTTTTTTAPSTSRNLALPPGVGPFSSDICIADIYGNGMVDGLAGDYAAAKAGRPLTDNGWQEMQTVVPQFIAKTSPQRSKLEQAGVPTSHPVYGDVDELLAAMNSMLDVAKAKDNSKILTTYERLKAADQRMIESCGAITQH